MTTPAPDQDADGFAADVDCDDQDPSVFPGALDICGDDRVTDCDRLSDDGLVTVDERFSTGDLQEALDVAPAGAVVRICPGTYTGTFSASTPVAIEGHGEVLPVLSGGGEGTVLAVVGGTSIRNLTLRDGEGVDGGGLRVEGAGEVVLEALVVTENRAQRGGGLSVGPGGHVVMVGGQIEENSADEGGGVHADHAVVELGEGVVADNHARVGGGLLLQDATVSGGIVQGNFAGTGASSYLAASGGGAATRGASSIDGTAILGNGGEGGGGVAALGGTLSLVGCDIAENAATFSYYPYYGGWVGGGMYVDHAQVTLDGTVLHDNFANSGGGVYLVEGSITGGQIQANEGFNSGGGLFMAGGELVGTEITENVSNWGGGIGVEDIGHVTVVDATIERNTGSMGGGIAAGGRALSLQIAGGRIAENEAFYGGGVSVEDAVVVISGVRIEDNRTEPHEGAGILVTSGSARIEDSFVLRNAARFSGGGAEVFLGAILISTDSDWGEGADDNAVQDVCAGIMWFEGGGCLGNAYEGLGSGSSFTCGADGLCTVFE